MAAPVPQALSRTVPPKAGKDLSSGGRCEATARQTWPTRCS